MKRKITFLLGAGASVKAGVPPMIPFTRYFREELDNDATRRDLIPYLDSIIDYWESLNNNRDFDLEILYEILYMVNRPGITLQNPLANVPPILKRRETELLEYYLKSYIQRRCLAISHKKVGYLKPLVRFLDFDESLLIGSLNYDVCVEVFSAKHRLSCFTGFEEATGSWKPQTLTGKIPIGSIELLKMHGSVTWFESQPGKYESLSPVMSREEQVLFKSARGRTLERMLIYPGRSKLPLFGPYLRLIELFRAALINCQLCIAVGYRFGDNHLRTLFAEAMAINKELSLLIVSPDALQVSEDLSQSFYRGVDISKIIPAPKKFELALHNDWLHKKAKDLTQFRNRSHRAAQPSTIHPPTGCSLVIDRNISGLTSDSHGKIYATTRVQGRGEVILIDPLSGSSQVVFDYLKRPRGIILQEASNLLFVIDNEFRAVRNEPKTLEGIEGIGRIWQINLISGDALPLNSLGKYDSYLLRRLIRQNRADLRAACPSILSWPTDLTFRTQRTIVATEARSLVEIELATGSLKRYAPFRLPFNICSIKPINQQRFLILDAGVTDFEIGTGRLLTVNLATGTSRVLTELGPLATSATLSQDKQNAYVAHTHPSSRGYVVKFNISSRDVVSKWEGFNGAGSMLLLEAQNTLLVSTRDGLLALDLR